jgi:ribosomal protein S18 acetylase RimI-like enzyme
VTIRPIQEADLAALEWDGLYRHYRRVFQQTFQETRQGKRLMLAALNANEIIGQVFVQLKGSDSSLVDGKQRGYLYALRVKADWQRRGVGRQLITAGEAELARRRYRMAVIAAAKTNLAARRLYERLGYAVFAEDPGLWYYTDADGKQQRIEEPAWLLEKQLLP